MGLTNKLATKIRTKDQVGAVGVRGDWASYGSIVAAAIVRGAACALASTNVSSTAFRGNDFLGINATKGTSASRIWVEQNGLDQWLFSLGVTKVSYGHVFDWQLQFDVVEGPTGRSVKVSTPAQSTHDGTLMNKHQFMETRELVLTGLGLGKAPNLSVEEALTRSSQRYVAWPLLELLVGVEHLDLTIRTTLTALEIDERLNGLPSRVVDRGIDLRTVKVGAAGQLDDQIMSISTSDHGEYRDVRIRFDIELNAQTALNIINVKHARFLSSVVQQFLKAGDPTAHVIEAGSSTDSPND